MPAARSSSASSSVATHSPVGAGSLEPGGDDRGAMPVRVGLDDRVDPHTVGQQPPDGGEVGGEPVEVDLEPGGPRQRRQAGRSETRLDRQAQDDAPGPGSPRTAKPSRRSRRFRSAMSARRRRARAISSGQVRREQPRVAEPLADGLAGEAVEVRPRGTRRRTARRPWASSEPIVPDSTSPVPPAGERRVLERRHGDLPGRGGDDRAGPLEHDDVAPLERRGRGGRGLGRHRRRRGRRPRRERDRCRPAGAGTRRRAASGRRPAHALPPVVGRGQPPERLGVEDDRRGRPAPPRPRGGPR